MSKDIKLIHTTYELQAALDEKHRILKEAMPFARIVAKNGLRSDGTCKCCEMDLDGNHEDECIIGKAVRFVELGGVAVVPKPNKPLTRGDLRRIRLERKLMESGDDEV